LIALTGGYPAPCWLIPAIRETRLWPTTCLSPAVRNGSC